MKIALQTGRARQRVDFITFAVLIVLILVGVALRSQSPNLVSAVINTAKIVGGFLLAVMALNFIENLWPDHPPVQKKPEELKLNLALFMTSGLIVGRIVFSFASVVFAWFLLLHIPRLSPTWLTNQPKLLQGIEAFILRDFLLYIRHWMMHKNSFLWKFHAIHHSSEHLTWHSGLRAHPVEDLLTTIITILPGYCLGFHAPTLGAMLSIITIYDVFLHSNVKINFGPLKYLVVTPEFHRWHHTNEFEHIDKNYGSSLPIFDFLFGTAHMPKGVASKSYGLVGEPIKQTYWDVLKYPFVRSETESSPAATVALGEGDPEHMLGSLKAQGGTYAYRSSQDLANGQIIDLA